MICTQSNQTTWHEALEYQKHHIQALVSLMRIDWDSYNIVYTKKGLIALRSKDVNYSGSVVTQPNFKIINPFGHKVII